MTEPTTIPLRPKLTDRQKLLIMARYCRCPGVPEMGIKCGRHLPTMAECEFDHIGQRSITGDDSLENFRPLCPDCHDQKTNGLGGEKRITTAGSDTNRRAKVRALSAEQEEFRRKVLARPCGEKRKRKGTIPSRPFPKRRRRTKDASK